MLKLVIALFALSGMIAFAATNEQVSRALNITRPDVRIQISGTVERNGQNFPVEEVKAVTAGEMLDWKVNSVNKGNAAAENYQVIGQIPAGTSFVAGSARGSETGRVTFSIDDGKSFSERPVIDEQQADGTVKKVAAPASMYTQLKFELKASLAADENFEAAYRVSVK